MKSFRRLRAVAATPVLIVFCICAFLLDVLGFPLVILPGKEE